MDSRPAPSGQSTCRCPPDDHCQKPSEEEISMSKIASSRHKRVPQELYQEQSVAFCFVWGVRFNNLRREGDQGDRPDMVHPTCPSWTIQGNPSHPTCPSWTIQGNPSLAKWLLFQGQCILLILSEVRLCHQREFSYEGMGHIESCTVNNWILRLHGTLEQHSFNGV